MVRPTDGRGFAFIPRTLVARPRAFGQVPGLLTPAHDVAETGERYRAAMVQHLMAGAARSELLASEGISPSAFVSRFAERGMGADRTRRIFRGETMAQLTDLVFWSSQFPAVGIAIAEYTSTWTLPESYVEKPALTTATAVASALAQFAPVEESRRGEEMASGSSPAAPALAQAHSAISPIEEPSRAETFREQLEAQRRESAAPGLRRTPQNPYSSTPRRMR